MEQIQKLALVKWKKTRRGLLTTGIVELILAYFAGSWALDSGSLWAYLLLLILVIGAIRSFVKAFIREIKVQK